MTVVCQFATGHGGRAALAVQPQFTPALNGLKHLRSARQAVAS
jgi:hypothetical protein